MKNLNLKLLQFLHITMWIIYLLNFALQIYLALKRQSDWYEMARSCTYFFLTGLFTYIPLCISFIYYKYMFLMQKNSVKYLTYTLYFTYVSLLFNILIFKVVLVLTNNTTAETPLDLFYILCFIIVFFPIILTILYYFTKKRGSNILETFTITEDEPFAGNRYRVWAKKSNGKFYPMKTQNGEVSFESLEKAKWILKLYARQEAILGKSEADIQAFGEVVWDAKQALAEISPSEVVKKLESENELLQEQLQKLLKRE